MLELNRLFLDAYVKVNKFFQQNNVNYYPASVGVAYKELFNRDSFACLSFYDKDNNQYYLYFNASYNIFINRMVFTSIGIVSRENLNLKKATYEIKTHIDSVDDVQSLLDFMKGVV
jgi:hypothetical protein